MAESEYDKMGEILELTRENNRILRAMHRSMVWSQLFTFIYWLFILGALGWSYYYVQPYITKYWNTFQQVSARLSEIEATGKALPSGILQVLEKVP